MKKYWTLLLSLIFLILSFIKSWYADYLFGSLINFDIFFTLCLFIIFNICFVSSIKLLFSEKLYINIVSVFLLILSALLPWIFPFREVKVKFDLDRYEEKRIEIIEKIRHDELKADDLGNIKLPSAYKKYSTSGEVTIYENDENGQVICFWVFRAPLTGSIQLMYSTGGEDLIWKNETGHSIISIKKLKDKWFYVETNY